MGLGNFISELVVRMSKPEFVLLVIWRYYAPVENYLGLMNGDKFCVFFIH